MIPRSAAATKPTPSLAAIGTALVAIGVFVRAIVGIDPFPGWSLDPLVSGGPEVALSPAMVFGLDLAVIFGAALVLASTRGRGVLIAAVLFTTGAIGALIHALPWSGGGMHHAPLAITWIAALAAGLAGAALRRRGDLAVWLVALGLGVAGVLVAKGGLQLLVEHPSTVAFYEQDKDAFLHARGWAPGSPEALAYERRLNQPEATGWFGLANVYGSVLAAVCVGWLGLVWAAPRDRRGLTLGAASLAAAAMCAVGVWMSGSKGATGAAALGLGGLGLLIVAKRFGRVVTPLRIAAAVLPLVVLAMVIVRGLVGERLSELSLLFRWHYLVGAWRIFTEHPIFGVGPDGFQNAYLLAKLPANPEEVTSPHCMPADWLATLGVFGAAWVGLVGTWVWRATAAAVQRPAEEREAAAHAAGEDSSAKLLALAAAAITAAAATIERAATTPSGALCRLIGLVLWIALGWLVLRIASKRPGGLALAAAGAGITLALHSMIELTPVNAGSAPLAMLLIGLGAGLGLPEPKSEMPKSESASSTEKTRTQPTGLASAALIALIGIVTAVGVGPALIRWDAALRSSAREASEAATLRMRLAVLGDPIARARSGDTPAQLATDVGAMLGEPAPTDTRALAIAIERAGLLAGERAADELRRAVDLAPRHHATRAALGRLLLTIEAEQRRLDVPQANGSTDPTPAAEAEAVALTGTVINPDSAKAWQWLGSVRAARAAIVGGAFAGTSEPSADLLRGAIEAWARAAELDPYSPDVRVKLADASAALGDREAAARWASAALEANATRRLDPLRQFDEQTTARMRQLAGEPAEPAVDRTHP